MKTIFFALALLFSVAPAFAQEEKAVSINPSIEGYPILANTVEEQTAFDAGTGPDPLIVRQQRADATCAYFGYTSAVFVALGQSDGQAMVDSLTIPANEGYFEAVRYNGNANYYVLYFTKMTCKI